MEEFELEPGEHVVQNVRTHPFVLVMELLPFALIFFLPNMVSAFGSYISFISPGSVAAFNTLGFPAHVLRFFSGIWYLAIWTAAFSFLTRYYLTVWVITNMRIVDIKQYSFFNRQVSSFLLVRVQDVTTDVSGMLGTLIGYGKLSVQTAGQNDEFCMGNIARPEVVRDVIMSQVAQLHHKDPGAGV
jgi:hypothetical protein